MNYNNEDLQLRSKKKLIVYTKNFAFALLSKVQVKIIKYYTMGKGDKKSKRGKINRGTFGARRPRIKKKTSIEQKINVGNKAKPK